MSDDVRVSQLAGGFNRIARDLDRAISAAKFNAAQRTLIDKARELSWAFRPGEPRPFRINTSELARITSYDRSYLSTQEAALVRCRVFTDNGDGTYHINKDYRDWLGADGRPRLTDAQVEYAVSITRVPRGVGKTQHGGRLESNEVLGKPNTAEEKTQHGGRLESNEVLGKPNTAEDSSQHSHRKDRAQRPQKRIETLETPEECVRDADTHTGDGDPVRSQPGRTPGDLAAVSAAARVLAGDLRTAHLGQRLLSEHNTPGLIGLEGWRWQLAANVQLGPKLTHSQRMSWPYLLAVARNLTEQDRDAPAGGGAPDVPPESKAAARRRQIKEDLRTFKIQTPKGIVE